MGLLLTFMFMANMGWNSSMNVGETQRMLCDRDPASGESRTGTVDADTVTGLAFMFSYMPQTASLLPASDAQRVQPEVGERLCAHFSPSSPLVSL